MFSESTLRAQVGFTTAVSDLGPRRNKACKNETAQQYHGALKGAQYRRMALKVEMETVSALGCVHVHPRCKVS